MRRYHKKSRLGCQNCKRRRIKCDESKPSCKNCSRHELQCSLQSLMPRTMKSSYLTPALSASPLDRSTRELMYHHQVSIVCTLAGTGLQSVHRVEIPKLGLSQPFLLSGIRAISALHLSTLIPSRRQELQTVAIMQQNAALSAFRSLLISPSFDDAVHACFAFTGNAVYYIMGLPDGLNADTKIGRCRIPAKDDENPHWFQMMRGMMSLLSSQLHKLVKGPFAPLLAGTSPPEYSEHPDDAHLAALEAMCLSPLTPPKLSSPPQSLSDSLVQCSHTAQLCLDALGELRTASAFAHSRIITETICDKTAMHIWPGKVSAEFVELIYIRDPRALVLLAHYCVLLKRNDHVWCLRGIGTGLLDNIWRELGEEWRDLIKWPMEMRPSCQDPTATS